MVGDIDIDSLEIKDVIDIKLLQMFQDNYAKSMNIASITVDKRGNPVTNQSSYTSFCNNFIHSTALGNKRCAESHRKGGEKAALAGKPYIYMCHAGLIDFAAPILIEDKQIGTILGGQILLKMPEKVRYIQIARRIGVDGDKLVEAVGKIKIISKKNVTAAAEVLFIVANALSQIGYEELKLKRISKSLKNEVLKKNLLLKESNKYNRLKTQLFTTISHELKTPINIIYSSLQLFENFHENSSLVCTEEIFLKYLKVMKQNCFRMIRLINNLMDMNKIELGSFTLNLRNNDIVKVIENITLSVVEYANLKNINIVFDTDIEEKVIAFDRKKFERIMLNLLSNSVKFTKPGGNIYVNIYDRNEYMLISVKDTGVGIPQNMCDKIFDAFTRVDASLRRDTEGSGVGLSLVKALVNMHDGEIIVRSKIGIGSEFIIKLPVKLVEGEFNAYDDEVDDLNDIVEKAKIEFSDIYFT